MLGNGHKIEFWLDHWHPLGKLRDCFNLMFVKARDKSITISQICELVRSSSWERLGDEITITIPAEQLQFNQLIKL